ncbi:MAG: hypothetical protein E6G49_01295 [Actinobacteria bacterium]|nr:MAG: hypothetical protein E6G49_01295 [Actinomycetota bacterium]
MSASQIRRCELRSGDEVSGPAREPRRGERHRALVHVDRVNGGEPQTAERPAFEDLTPVLPTRRLALGDSSDVLTRAVDLLTPLALGQRVLVMAAPRSGRTTLLRGVSSAIEGREDVELLVLLIDERPEEATAWRDAVPGSRRSRCGWPSSLWPGQGGSPSRAGTQCWSSTRSRAWPSHRLPWAAVGAAATSPR